ncbi:hypothetical protein GPECTOR_428g298 [Gonium pectorale]|uniref:Uncharacterized protein n=1 Tax=Gonium pectorale TaxID=33097 RepID=A0A150FV92_GONPE|nr:hypothetical protein GPECTOR_428g298 [Gonium pectorale]|eukprot:KXZ41498.1 hypothetical protein GPECTOR_428g298 [Gonium pectorale]
MRGAATNIGQHHGEDLADYRQQALQSLRKYMRGAVSLSLPNVSLEDGDVRDLLAALPRLQLLDAPGERKLTHAAVLAIAEVNTATAQRRSTTRSSLEPNTDGGSDGHGTAAGPDAPPSCPIPLRILNLQRCFQLHCSSLDALLATPGLGCLALSHLDFGRWPSRVGADVDAGLKSCGIKALALHNCLRLHGPALAALASAVGAGARFLLLGGSTLALAVFHACTSPPPLPLRAAELLASAYKPTLTTAAATVEAHLSAARHIVAAVLDMPHLVALELSFFPPPLVACVRRVLADEEATGRSRVDVWDFATDVGSLLAARRTLRSVLRVARPGDAGEGDGGSTSDPRVSSRGGEALDEQAAALLLRCAVNCSSVTRSTPLHLAAERGQAGGVEELLAAGAVVDARDTAGSTPLFLAAEAGHAGVLGRLLAAGADPRQGNAAGESPLYIAALRGHLGCVQALLEHCKARRIEWQDPELYGDAWTPLHAAAVANRADVAACLLQAAGAAGAGELVVAPNKYGQSVLHVAARKGSSQLLRLLLSAGGAAGVLGSRDGSGNTPVDVAMKNRHVAALAEFRRLIGGSAGGQQPAATARA